ncbi:MAG: RNA-directed DNA polymerase [Candidatus Competibacteraceae bacterium]
MLTHLQKGEVENLLQKNLGRTRVSVAKKLGIVPSHRRRTPRRMAMGSFDPVRAFFERLCATHDPTPEFRLVGDFPVAMHVSVGANNLVGHKFDAALLMSAYGSRLRRYRPEPGSPKSCLGNYHLEAVGSFQPRILALTKMAIEACRPSAWSWKPGIAVVAISMDPDQLLPPYRSGLHGRQSLSGTRLGIELTEWELSHTSFSAALSQWSNDVAAEMSALGCSQHEVAVGGVPIGLSLSRIIANALLVGLDRDIEQGLTPVYYGRYVDDLFPVLRDPGNLSSAEALLGFFAARTQSFPAPNEVKKGQIYLTLPGGFLRENRAVAAAKQAESLFLQGQGGSDLLSNIESQIRSVSSERRLMPSPDRLNHGVSQGAHRSGHPPRRLIRCGAPTVCLRRLGWAVQRGR